MDASQNVRLDYSNSAITIVQGVDNTQNTWISSNAAYTQAAFNQANVDVTSVSVSPGTYGSSTLIPVVTIAANGRITNISNVAVSGGGGITASGYLANSVIFANSAGYLSNVSDLSFTSSNNTLIVANITVPSVYTTVGGIVFPDGTSQSTAASGAATDQAARNLANTANVTAQAALVQANSASANTIVTQGVDVTQNTRLNVIENTDLSQNVSITTQNSFITIIQGTDVSQNARMTIIQGVDLGQNTAISSTDGKMQSAYNQANTGTVLAQAAYNQSNASFLAVNSAITIIQGTDVSQNTRMNISDGVDASQNVRLDYSNTAITIIQGTDVGQNSRMTIIEGVDATQNTNISNKVNLTGSLNQTISGNVTIGQDLIVSGNLVLTGNINSQNVQQLAVADPLILLGLGNYVSDTKDIGFAAHYNDGTNAHAGIIRDSGTKEFYVFQGYVPELDANNNVIITDTSFRTANFNTNYLKGNLIATTAVVNGIDLSNYTQAAFAQANVTIGVDVSQNARMTIIEGVDLTQNTNIAATDGKMQSAYNQANVTIGVDTTQNTRLTIIEATDVSQNARMTIIEGVDLGQNTAISSTDGKMQSAFNQANTDVTNISVTAGTYGSATIVPVITIAANGRISAVTNTTITASGGGTTSGYLANTVFVANTGGYLSNSTMSFYASNNTLYTSNTYVTGRVGFANSTTITSVVYQYYNATTNSLDTVFG